MEGLSALINNIFFRKMILLLTRNAEIHTKDNLKISSYWIKGCGNLLSRKRVYIYHFIQGITIFVRIEGILMRHGIMVAFIVVLAAVTQVNADCVKNEYGNRVCGKGQCKLDSVGKAFCAREGGGAVNGLYDNVLCGVLYQG
jgi:hypothetical protein